ncbi:Aste57867_20215 [Aphanomyces stellatus]|uniref:Aste57867_20215 protein n=1 Tax=Aphanomyces stellatus TaxID=120398 RepID=A0A485LFP3_9STRA|nr:hypothetical protein As57867_020149 [Aphanomyces stellatus]VFT96908.1 Aste57867_20215 [Aphanomyces stellatus]
MTPFSVFAATTSAPRAPSAAHLRSSSAPTAAPALPTPWGDVRTIVLATLAAIAVLVLGLALLGRAISSRRSPSDETKRTASVSVATSGAREFTHSDVGFEDSYASCDGIDHETSDIDVVPPAATAVVVDMANLSPLSDHGRASWITASELQFEKDVNDRFLAKLAAHKAGDRVSENASVVSEDDERTSWGASTYWRQMGTPTPDKCNLCDRPESEDCWVEWTDRGYRCNICPKPYEPYSP